MLDLDRIVLCWRDLVVIKHKEESPNSPNNCLILNNTNSLLGSLLLYGTYIPTTLLLITSFQQSCRVLSIDRRR